VFQHGPGGFTVTERAFNLEACLFGLLSAGGGLAVSMGRAKGVAWTETCCIVEGRDVGAER